jgi:hypothetical protein
MKEGRDNEKKLLLAAITMEGTEGLSDSAGLQFGCVLHQLKAVTLLTKYAWPSTFYCLAQFF